MFARVLADPVRTGIIYSMLNVLLLGIALATLPPVDHVVRIETMHHDAVYALQREFALEE